jgi:hypothetical protein
LLGPPVVAYGFILHDGCFVTVGILGSSFCGLSSINDHGVISGIYSDASGILRGFVGTPEGEPCGH